MSEKRESPILRERLCLWNYPTETFYRALESRDPRFDGFLFVAVNSTGIYCRPVCPARTPKYENCTFFGSAAAAQEAGFRPCLRCRPETAPEFASWRGTSNTVSRALALMAEGALDGEGASVDGWRSVSAWASASCGGCFCSTWEHRRLPWPRRGGSFSPST